MALMPAIATVHSASWFDELHTSVLKAMRHTPQEG